jgi:hypothetical protein
VVDISVDMRASERNNSVGEQLSHHFDTLVQDLEMMGPSVELIMASVSSMMCLLDEHDRVAACQLERVERARRRLVAALTSAGDLRGHTARC